MSLELATNQSEVTFDSTKVARNDLVLLVPGTYNPFFSKVSNFNMHTLRISHYLIEYDRENYDLFKGTTLVGLGSPPHRLNTISKLPYIAIFPHSSLFSEKRGCDENPWLRKEGWNRIYYGEKDVLRGLNKESREFPYVQILDAIVRSRKQ